ncbi:NADPH-dependent FMN reductase, partial [Actinocorallia lasiicapitis]
MNAEQKPLRLAMIVGSAREGGRGAVVARWLAGRAALRPDLELDVLECTEDPERARARIAEADAYLVVTPEFNHSYPGPLKTFLDSFYKEWQAKPAGFVSYGGVSGGLRAVEHLRQVFAEFHATTVRETVSFHNVWDHFCDERGFPAEPDAPNAAAERLLAQLAWWARALADARR